jgi:hypothetical protein
MGKPEIGAVFDPQTGLWKQVDKYRVGAQKSHAGEQSMGFFLGERGYFILEGPSGAGGHAMNAHGFDGVAYHPTTKELIIYDNKAWKKGSVGEASAIVENLEKNLDDLIKRISKASPGGPMHGVPHSDAILRKLKQARSALRSGGGWPKSVKLHVYGASGKSTRVSKALAKYGVEFKNFYEVVKVRRPWHMNPAAKAVRQQLAKDARKMEIKAFEELSKKEAARAERRVGLAVASHAKIFAKKRLPKLIAERLIKMAASKSAKRALSFVPVLGWGFNAQDAYHGAQDIFRGHVARGLAGIGLAAADVASDFLHLGDAVSGVGGTVVSLGAQAATVAGQVAIEIDRAKERFEELGGEIEKLGRLPDDARLRDYYDMDDEAIEQMKKDFEKKEDEPVGEPDLPGDPPEINLPPGMFVAPDPPPPPPDYDEPFFADPPPLGSNRSRDSMWSSPSSSSPNPPPPKVGPPTLPVRPASPKAPAAKPVFDKNFPCV